MKIVSKISLAILPAMFLLGGCGTTGEVDEGAATEPTTSTTEAPPSTSAGTETAQVEAQPMVEETKPAAPVDPLDDPSSILAQRTVYFAFDSSTIPDDAMPLIKAHADYLVNNPSTGFTLEGHCDERGTREYNIALGERRADAVRRMLMANGVSASQINVISYGEERPAKLGHSEDSWQYNRRAYFAYSGS
jgi:peptidoglycan-associated lipoprotein